MPRGGALTPSLLATERGEPYLSEPLNATVQPAIDNALVDQINSDVTIVNNGELGEIGYLKYMIERLEGFGGRNDFRSGAAS